MKIKIVIAVALFNLFAVCNVVIAQIPTYVPTNGLVGWWPFTGNANDISGNNLNANVIGANLTTDRFGIPNSAYNFDYTTVGFGSQTDEIYIPFAPILNSAAVTISIWVYQRQYVWAGNTNPPMSTLAARFQYGSGGQVWMLNSGTNALDGFSGSQNITLNSWTHILTSFENGTGKMYVNGQLISTTNNLAALNTSGNSGISIGESNQANGYWWPTDGIIDDFAIWNRALTQQEITNLYHANNGPQATISTANNSICAGQSATLTATVANAGTSCNTAGLPPSLNNGLVGYWPFCGNANDASGNGNNGTVNGATLTTDRFGAANQSYGFDGVNDNIRVNNNALFSFLLNSSFTSNVWFKIQTLPNGTKFLISQGDGDAQHQNRLWGSYLTQNSVNNWFRGNNEPNQVFNTHPSLQVNAWQMVTMVRDFNSTIKMYIDGQLVDTDVDIAGMASPFTQIRDIYFGALYDAYNAQLTAFLNGQLDDIGIWNRALSAQEVSQLYNAGQATYLWSNGTTTPSITVTPTQTTTYTCTITMNGASTTQSQTITVNPVPTVNAGQDQTVFAGTQVTLSGSGASSYAWNNGVTNNTPFAATTTTTYTVTGTTNGCSATDQVLITVLPSPSISINTNDTICNGTSTTLTASVANAGTSCAAPGLSGTLTNGLVGYWPFCGNANDLSGNGNNGTVNGATLINDRFSSANSAYSYNSNYILTNYLGISSNNPRSFSLWKNGTFGDLIAYGGSVDLPGCGDAFRIIDNNGTIEINTDCSSRSFQIPNYNQANWYHIVVVGGVSLDNFQVYVNGVICNLSNTQGTGVYNTSVDLPVNFGRCHRGNSYYSGKIDDIGIWNRALTQQEITQLYNAGQATYSWSPGGANTPSITVSPTQTTTYTCTISMNGATTTQSQTITVNPVPTVNAGQDQTVFAGTQVTLSGSGASSYAWNNGVTNNTPFAATTTTTYTVTGTTNGCSATDQVLVTVLPAPSISATNDTICNGTSTTITATVANAGTSCAAPGLSGTLTNGLVGYWPFCGNANDLSGNGNNGTVNGATLTNDRFGLANSAYSFDGVNDFVQCTQSGISGNHSVTVSFWIKSGIGSGHVFSYGGNGSSGNDFRVLINSYGSCGNSIAFDIYNSGTGFTTTFGNFWDNYTIVYNSSLGNSVLSSSIYKNGTLLSNSCFTSNAVATNFLNNFPITFGRYHGTIPTDYLNGQLDDIGIWNRALNAAEIQALYTQGQATYLWSNGATTPSITVTPTQTTTYTCTITMNGATTTQSQTITVNALPTVSAGQNQAICAGSTLTLSGTGASTYTWNNNIQNGVPFTPLSTQTYTVTGTTTSGCVNTAQVTVSVNPLPTVNAGQAQIVCAGTSVALSGSGASSYAWNNGVSNGVSFVPNNTQTYTVTGTDANGCTNTAQVTVTVNVPPAVSGGSPQTVCVGTPVTLNGSGASSYSWNNNVQNGVPFIPLSTQTYTLTGTAVNGCTNTAQVQVVVNALPAVSGGQNQSVCAGASLVLNGAGALTYTWNNNIQNGVSFIPNATQTYTVIGTNANGCQNSAQVQVTVNPLPTVGAGLPIAVCSGAYVVLNGSGAQTYAWSNGIQNAVPFVPGNTQVYTVTGTDANGCTDTDQILVTVNSYPQVSAGQNQTVCAGDSVTLTASGAPSYTWSNGIVNGFSFVPASTTTYSVIGNSNGCLDTAQVTVTVNTLPNVIAGQAQTVCAGSSVTLNATGASSYLWDNNVQNSVAFVPNTTQTYTVTGTDANGCTNTAQVQVTVNALPNVSGGTNQTVCAGTSVTLSCSGASTYAWNNNVQDGVAFTPASTQTYTVIGTDTNGCQGTDQVLVEVLSPTVSEINEVACVEFILNGQSYTQSGTYIQNLSNVAGCDSTLTLNLTINELPSIPVISSSNDNILSINAQANVTYQWIFCDSGLSINNASDTIYSPTVNGVYGIELTNGCGTVTSECVTIDNMNVPEFMNEILVYPNPSLGLVYIEGLTETSLPFALQDITGRVVLEGIFNASSNVLDITRLSSGNYRILIPGYGIFSLVKQ